MQDDSVGGGSSCASEVYVFLSSESSHNDSENNVIDDISNGSGAKDVDASTSSTIYHRESENSGTDDSVNECLTALNPIVMAYEP
jgi:hypothetical protein